MLEDSHMQESINITVSCKWRMALWPSATESLATDYHSRTIGPSEGKKLWRIRICYLVCNGTM